MLLPGERPRVDAAGNGLFAVLHRDSIPDAVRAVRERPVDAVLVSVHRCGADQMEVLGHLVREFPSIPTVALVSQHDPGAIEMLLRLGASGVRQVVDVTSPAGWSRLRQVVGQPATRAVARIQRPDPRARWPRRRRRAALRRGDDPARARGSHRHGPRGAALGVEQRAGGAGRRRRRARPEAAAPARPAPVVPMPTGNTGDGQLSSQPPPAGESTTCPNVSWCQPGVMSSSAICQSPASEARVVQTRGPS